MGSYRGVADREGNVPGRGRCRLAHPARLDRNSDV